MAGRVRRAWRALSTSFWFWPALFAVGGILLAYWTAAFGAGIPLARSAAGTAIDGAAAAFAAPMLTTIAVAAVTIVTFVFTTLMVVLQLASNQLSPRILRRTVREGRAQIVMAIIVGTFAYAMVALFLSYGEPNPAVPAVLVLVGIVLSLADLLAFLYFTGFVVDRVRAPSVIRSVAKSTAQSIRTQYRHSAEPPAVMADAMPGEHVHEVRSKRTGSVTGIETSDLVRWADRNGALVELLVGLGDPVSVGTIVAEIHSDSVLKAAVARHVRSAMVIEDERTVHGDPPYGFRLLVDIANRALSPAVNDPTTAVQVLDALQGLLRELAQRPERPGYHYDSSGRLRLVIPEMSFRGYLNLAIQEIYLYGKNSPQVTQRIVHLLEDLEEATAGPRRLAVHGIRNQIVLVGPMLPLDEHEVTGTEA